MSSSQTARIAVVGPGRMGTGLSLAFACAGFSVDLVDLKHRPDPLASLRRAAEEITVQLDLLIEFGAVPAASRERILNAVAQWPAEEAPLSLAAADVVLEAVPEVMEAKRQAYETIGATASADVLLASTTSSFLVDSLAELVAEPERFLNAHWLNPACLIPLVEVSTGERTSPEATKEMLHLLRRAGKVPITISDSPGYIVPRLQALVMNEAARMLEEGVATAADLDTATRLGLGLRFSVLGPIEFIDWGGVDTLLRASEYLSRELAAERFEPPRVVAERVAAGATGMDAGRGMLVYSDGNLEQLQRQRIAELVERLRHLDLLPHAERTDDRRRLPVDPI